jgi:D-glycero-D-manno-heptose 1,7-bisphosphate phosphatase
MRLHKAAFIDRDGVLNVDHGYVYRREDFQWLPGAVEALQALQQAGYALVVVTNQSGVARGLYSLDQMQTLHEHVSRELRDMGVLLTGIYACPHLPDAAVPSYRVNCDCRKPQPGLILQAVQAHGLDVTASCLFGDKASDITAGRSAGVAHCCLIGDAATAAACGADAHSASLQAAVQRMLVHP